MSDRAVRVARLVRYAETYIDEGAPWVTFLASLVSETEVGRTEFLDTITEAGVFPYVKEVYAQSLELHQQVEEEEDLRRRVHELHPDN